MPARGHRSPSQAGSLSTQFSPPVVSKLHVARVASLSATRDGNAQLRLVGNAGFRFEERADLGRVEARDRLTDCGFDRGLSLVAVPTGPIPKRRPCVILERRLIVGLLRLG